MARPPLPIGTWGKINRVQRGRGVWVAYGRYRDHDGVTRQLERTAATAQKAENLLLEAFRDRLALVDDAITAESTIARIAEAWYDDEIAGLRAEQTEDLYRGTLRRVVLPGLGGIRIRELTVARADRFLKAVTESRGPSTAKVAKTVLTGIIGYAAQKGAIATNPLRDVSRIKRAAAAPVRVLDVAQLNQVRTGLYADELAVRQDLAEPIDFMLATGQRIGEVLAVRWFDLELDANRPYALVRATIVKGRVQEKPKSEASRRKVYLPPWIVEVLRARRDAAPENPQQLVFASVRGTPRDPSNLRRQWREARARLGFDWVKPHTFRKSVATLLEDPELARKQLGHADSRTTEKHYIPRVYDGPSEAAAVLQQIAEPALTQRNAREAAGTTGTQRGPRRVESA